MIKVSVVTNTARLTKIREESGRIWSSEEFFKTIPLHNFETKVLAFLRASSPEGKSDYITYQKNLGYSFLGAKSSFKDGWRVARETAAGSISFKMWNILNTVGGKEGQQKFAALEYGGTASTWIAQRTFKFRGSRGWTTIKQGRTVKHAAREGASAQMKTSEYIRDVLIPEIATHVNDIIAARMA